MHPLWSSMFKDKMGCRTGRRLVGSSVAGCCHHLLVYFSGREGGDGEFWVAPFTSKKQLLTRRELCKKGKRQIWHHNHKSFKEIDISACNLIFPFQWQSTPIVGDHKRQITRIRWFLWANFRPNSRKFTPCLRNGLVNVCSSSLGTTQKKGWWSINTKFVTPPLSVC